jgi:hypothetical protein
MIESNSAGRTQEGKIVFEYELCGPGREVAVRLVSGGRTDRSRSERPSNWVPAYL